MNSNKGCHFLLSIPTATWVDPSLSEYPKFSKLCPYHKTCCNSVTFVCLSVTLVNLQQVIGILMFFPHVCVCARACVCITDQGFLTSGLVCRFLKLNVSGLHMLFLSKRM